MVDCFSVSLSEARVKVNVGRSFAHFEQQVWFFSTEKLLCDYVPYIHSDPVAINTGADT